MSSPTTSRTLGSFIFARSLSIGFIAFVFLVAFSWCLEGITRARVTANLRSAITAQADNIETIFQNDGVGELIDGARRDGRAVWPEDWYYDAVIEREFLFRLIGIEDQTLAGFEDLDPPNGFATFDQIVDDGDRSIKVITLRFDLSDDHQLIVGRSLPYQLRDIRNMAIFATLILTATVIPLSGVIGWRLSRKVGERLNELATSVTAVGDGDIDQRAALSNRDDEFDRFTLELNSMLDRIGTLTRNVRAVSVGVAHDLKTPASNIGGRLQLIERDIDDTNAIRVHLDKADAHLSALLRTLDAILRLGEVEAGRRKAAFQKLNVSSLVEDLAESFEPVLADADKHLSSKITPHLWIEGDPDLMTQMVTNLLENVAEHARDGASAWISVKRHEDAALIIVGDDGPGIPETYRDKIFDRFFRVESSRTSPGNGLGLSLVKAIAELHSGSVSLHGDQAGAVFEVEIPLTGGLSQP
ncbi:MAG: HAMP domain-containing sensor histidine kinase [Pseudomonadota bacterium]